MGIALLYAIIASAYTMEVYANVACRNEQNKIIDWYVIYKFPKIETEMYGTPLRYGMGYAFLSAKGKWLLSDKNTTSDDSVLGNTLNKFYDQQEELAYLMYNDEPPVENSGTTVGHTKGVVAFGKDTGFWLIHSIPKFPPANYFNYPNNGLENGQSILCVTFKTEELNQIGKQLLFNSPKIYAKGVKEDIVESLDNDVRSLFTDNPKFVRKAPFTRAAILRSKNNKLFTSFAKDNQFDDDLYSAMVAPELKTPLYVESWRRGSGTPLPPSCNIYYTVEDIEKMNITVMIGRRLKSIGFLSTEDHSKWAISSRSNAKWVCVGDINRMASQEKRAGGTMCFISSAYWGAYMSGVSETSKCDDY